MQTHFSRLFCMVPFLRKLSGPAGEIGIGTGIGTEGARAFGA